MQIKKLTGQDNPNIVQNRPTKVSKIMKLGMIKPTVERYPRTVRIGAKPKTPRFERSFSVRFKPKLKRRLSRKRLHHHRPMTTIVCVSDREREDVVSTGDGTDDLSDGAFSPGDELDCGES